MSKNIKVLVADDSSIMRLLISDILNEFSDIEVIATANNGKEALEKTLTDKPDVVIMDMIMGQYSGAYGVDHIMNQRPTPIILLSALGNSDLTPILDALHLGAFDYLNKPAKHSTKLRDIGDELAIKVREASAVNLNSLINTKSVKNQHKHSFTDKLPYDVVVIGASTGGPSAIEKVLMKFPENLPIPVLVVQHMPEHFIPHFAQRLNNCCALDVKLAPLRSVLEPNNVYVAGGLSNLIVKRNHKNQIVLGSTSKKYKEFNNPSINALMVSVSDIYKERAIGVILTGMGADGVEGITKIKTKGGYTIAQDEKSSVVFGMPKRAINSGNIDSVVPIDDMGMFIIGCLA